MALNRWSEALRAWEDALKYDPEDPHAYLGRAWAFERLGQWDRVLGDLEQAAGWAGDRAGLLAQIALAHAVCLPHRPDRLPRFLALARRAVSAALPRRSDFRRI
jgi:tetratricopeptide (TPR) repeat protein